MMGAKTIVAKEESSVSATMFAAGLKTFAATKPVWRHQTDRPLRVETQLACNIYLCGAVLLCSCT